MGHEADELRMGIERLRKELNAVKKLPNQVRLITLISIC